VHPGSRAIKAEQVTRLEESLDGLNDDLPPLKDFILPAAVLPQQPAIARTIARRCRAPRVVACKEGGVSADLTQYLNRLSDLLFVVAVCSRDRSAAPRFCGATIAESALTQGSGVGAASQRRAGIVFLPAAISHGPQRACLKATGRLRAARV